MSHFSEIAAEVAQENMDRRNHIRPKIIEEKTPEKVSPIYDADGEQKHRFDLRSGK